ncbi:RICIN domain-containing protein [Rhizohabitans arisaemae]|uniref:RICIN domain-containing protein n=1 Tax=Rhizohabitans arisaemae TaxID=2720610 RepID=UPI0024B0E46D|nr:RICIN domain-containing protein [Rhizohabitans arisaemae]
MSPSTVSAKPPPTPCADHAAATEAAAKIALSCNRRVEVTAKRSPTAQVFANPDGTLTMESSAMPRRVKRADGSWADIDPSLRAGPDGALAPVASTLDVRFSGGGAGPMVTVGQGAEQVALTWPEALPKPSVAGDTATYGDVYPGTDLHLRATGTGFTHVLEVKSAQAAAHPALRRLGYRLSGGADVRLRENSQGGVDAVTADGRELLHSGGASMWDSAATTTVGKQARLSSLREAGVSARQAHVKTRFTGGSLVTEPDTALLTGPDTRFPLFIDPAYLGPTGASRWAYATSTNVNRTDEYARIGRDPAGNYEARSFFEFATAPLAGSKIMSANFSIDLYHSSSCGPTPTNLWHSASISGTPRADWSPSLITVLNTQSAAANKDDCFTPAIPKMIFDGNLAANLQANAANPGAGAYTLALAAPTECNCNASREQWKKFIAHTARLIVHYNHIPRTPAATDMSIDPSFDCTPSGLRVNTLNGITLRATLSDGNGDVVKADWTVNGIAAQYAPPDSAFAASGSDFTTTLPAAAFTENTTYSWTVRGVDEAHAGADGPLCTFTVDNSVPGSPVVASADLALGTGLIVPAPPASAVTGRAARVTLAPASGDTDVAGYLIGVGAGTARDPGIWVPAAPDGRAVAPVVPIASGSTINYLRVRARDLSGQLGGTVTYMFRAGAGAAVRVRGDATGDGRPDLTVLADAGGGKSALWRWTADPAGTGLFEPIATQDTPGSYATASTTVAQGDFDGDGLGDVAVLQPKGPGSALTVQRSDGNNLLGTPELWSDPTWAPATMKTVAGDFTGDGKDDLLVLKDDGSATWRVWVLRATGTAGNVQFAAPAVWWSNPPGHAEWSRMKVVAGDFNGDGKTDFGHFYDYGSCHTKVWIHYSTGSALQSGTMQWDGGVNNACWDRASYIIGDFNGDGKDDLGNFYDYGSCQTKLWTHPANAAGTGFDLPVLHFDSGQNSWCRDAVEPSVADDNADGKDDVTVVYRCCGPGQRVIWRFVSAGATMAAPRLVAKTALNSGGRWALAVDQSGVYKLMARHSGMCVDVAWGSTANGAAIWQWGCHGYGGQAFRVVFHGAGQYMLQPAHTTGMCLSAHGSANGNGAIQYQCGPAGDQVYKLEYVSGTGDGTLVRMRPLHTGRCLDVSNVSMDQGAAIIQYDCYGNANQDFYLQRTTVAPPP